MIARSPEGLGATLPSSSATGPRDAPPAPCLVADSGAQIVLVDRRWSFGGLGGRALTDDLLLAADGSIQGYQHENEASWRVSDGRLEIHRRDGAAMWRSEGISIAQTGVATITLRAVEERDVLFFLRSEPEWRRLRLDRLSASDYLFPTDLAVSPDGISRVLLIGSCLTSAYHDHFRGAVPSVAFDLIPYNIAGQLPEEPPAPVDAYDLQYVQIPLRSVLTDRVVAGHRLLDPDFADTILREACDIIDVMLSGAMAYNERAGLLTMVAGFLVPQMSAAASLDLRGSSRDLAWIVRRLNEYLAEGVRRYRNAWFLDADAIAASMGKRYAADDMVYFYTHAGVVVLNDSDAVAYGVGPALPALGSVYELHQEEFYDATWAQIVATWRSVRQIDQVKAVVFDLDNTLWRGQLAEHYRPDAAWRPNIDGWPLGVWEAVQHLRARGILVAVCSKNDHETVAREWDNVVSIPFVALADFASVKINWLPKAENIRAICQEFSIKPKSVVFVDDNPVERAAVKAELPDVRVIGANPYLTRRILLWAPETQIARMTAETGRREGMVRSQIEREETRTTMTREAFLASLGCHLLPFEVAGLDDARFGRVIELVNKTNQFNTTGRRWSHVDIARFIEGGGRLLAFEVRDRFVEYGLVGVLFLEGTRVVQFVMSCRVLGMEVEVAAVAEAVSRLREAAPGQEITAPLVETPDNTPCRTVFGKSGFVSETTAEGTTWRLAAGTEPVRPAHVRTA